MQFPAVPDGSTAALITRVDRSAYDVLTVAGPGRIPAAPSARDHPAGDHSARDHPARDHPARHHPARDHPARDHSAGDHSARDHPAGDHSARDHPARDHPAADLPAGDSRSTPTVGDFLELRADTPPRLLPRTSLLVRGTARGTSVGQPLAANVDHVLICLALSGPLPLRRLERLLALAWESGAVPVVVLTKADLCADVDAAVRKVQPCAPGAAVLAVSAEAGDTAALSPYTCSTLVLLGASGAGKSTIVNALLGSQVMDTGDTRDVDGKGRHTTSHRELLLLPGGGMIIDTPGLRGISLHAAADDGLALAFADVEELAQACRFADCAHVGEPGCAVLTSIEAGDLEQDRVDAWRKLQRELAFQLRRTDARLRAQESRRWRAVSRANRARGGRP